jgi:hypothetical protein
MQIVVFLTTCLLIKINTFSFGDILPYFSMKVFKQYNYKDSKIILQNAKTFQKIYTSDEKCHLSFYIATNISSKLFQFSGNIKAKVNIINPGLYQ